MSVQKIGSVAHPSNADLVTLAKAEYGQVCEHNPAVTQFIRGRSLRQRLYSDLAVEMVLDDSNSRFVWSLRDGDAWVVDTTEKDTPAVPEKDTPEGDKKDGDDKENNANTNEKPTPEPARSTRVCDFDASTRERINGERDVSQFNDIKILNGIRDITSLVIQPDDIPQDLEQVIDDELYSAPLNLIWEATVSTAEGSDGQLSICVQTTHMFYLLRKLYSRPLPTERAELESSSKIAQCVWWSANAMLSFFVRAGFGLATGKPQIFRDAVAHGSVLPLDVLKMDKVLERFAQEGRAADICERDAALLALQDLTVGVSSLASQYVLRVKDLLAEQKPEQEQAAEGETS